MEPQNIQFRLPTKEEFNKLLTHFLRWNASNSGLDVMNDKGEVLFLPADGYERKTSRIYKGSYGYYWSSDVCEGNLNNAYNLYFNSTNHWIDLDYCYLKQSIRLVSDKEFSGGIEFDGIYWKPSNEKRLYTWDEAINKFG